MKRSFDSNNNVSNNATIPKKVKEPSTTHDDLSSLSDDADANQDNICASAVVTPGKLQSEVINHTAPSIQPTTTSNDCMRQFELLHNIYGLLQTLVNDVSTKVTGADQQLRRFETNIKAMQQAYEQKVSQLLDRHQTEMQEFTDQNEEQISTFYRQKQEEITTLQKHNDEIIFELRSELTLARQERNEFKTKLDGLSQVASTADESAKLLKKIGSLEQTVDFLRKYSTTQEQKVASLTTQLTQQQQTFNDLEKQYKHNQTKLEKLKVLEDNTVQFKNKISDLLTALNDKDENIEGLSKEIRTLQNTNYRLTTDISTMERVVQSSSANEMVLNDIVSTLTNENDALRKETKEQSEIITALNKKVYVLCAKDDANKIFLNKPKFNETSDSE